MNDNKMADITPLVSIIIATYNAGSDLERCIESILSQDSAAWELIIIDGLSADETTAIIQKHSDSIAYWHSKKDQGIYDAWNQGIERAKGSYICFIGADDKFADSSAISRLLPLLEMNEFEIVSSKGRFLKKSGGSYIIGNAWNYIGLERRITICHPGLMHRRKLFEKHGKFDMKYKIAGDYEFLLRLPAETKTAHLDSITVDISDGGVSRMRYNEMLREKRLIQENCRRIGKRKAAWNYYFKLLKIPVARMLNIPY